MARKPLKIQRRHFEFIAETLSDMRPPPLNDDTHREWYALVRAFGRRLEATNPGFSSSRFYTACGLTDATAPRFERVAS